MKNTLSYFAFLVAFTSILLSGCSRKVQFMQSSVVPAAEGNVKVKKDKNSNYHISLSVMRLAKPERLDPAKDTYLVWIDTQDNKVMNIGQLSTSSGLFSSTLKSSLETETPFEPTSVYITAENNDNLSYPQGPVILRTGHF